MQYFMHNIYSVIASLCVFVVRFNKYFNLMTISMHKFVKVYLVEEKLARC